MTITLMGFILLPLGILLCFLPTHFLLLATVFFAPFQSSSLINFEVLDFGLMPSYYFGLLFMVKFIVQYLIDFFRGKDEGMIKKLREINRFLLLFTAYSILSVIIAGILYLTVFRLDAGMVFRMITQLIYLLYCVIFYIFVYLFLKKSNENLVELIVRFQIYAFIFIAVWGIYQFIAHRFQLPYSQIFDTRIGVKIGYQLYAQNLFRRVQSVALEPSMLAYYLVPTMALILSYKMRSLTLKIVVIILGFISGILTTSTTFLVGLVLFVGLILIDKQLFGRDNAIPWMYKSIGIGSALIIGILMVLFFPNVVKYMFILLEEKLTLGDASASPRLALFIQSVKLMISSFFLGKGFGYFRSNDLLGTLLANVGVIGTGSFLVFLGVEIVNGRRIAIKMKYPLLKGLLLYLVILFFLALIAVPEPYYLFIWINLALLAYINRNYRMEKTYR